MQAKNTITYHYKLHLASQSPRRIDFLNQLKLQFEHFSVDIDESQLQNERPLTYLSRVVHDKKEEALKRLKTKKDALVLVADTIVVLGDTILQKPVDKKEAKTFLQMLSNRWHQVITGYALATVDETLSHYEFIQTDVLFKELSDAEIDFYLNDDEYIGKAGGYAIQGLGGFMIEKFVGSYSNVVGLPIMEVFSDLQKYKIIELRGE